MNKILLFILACIVSAIAACSPITNFMNLPTPGDQPSLFSTGTTKIVETQSIGNSGGIITVSNGSMKDVKISFPSGSLPGNNTVTIGSNDGKLSSAIGTYPGSALVVNMSDNKDFNKQASITVPLPDGDVVPVPFYVDDEGKLNVCQLISIDRVNKTFTFETFHASTYLWVFVKKLIDKVEASYAPGNDGFQIDNQGSSWNRGGECFGMTSFSLWYFKNVKKNDGNFYPKFMSTVAQDRTGANLTGQDIIATRAHNSISQQWNNYYSGIVTRSRGLTGADHFALITTTMSMTKCPVLIYLYDMVGGSGAHSVLAYAVNGNDLSIYDPNWHNEVNRITYNPGSQSFNQYVDSHNALRFNGIAYNGDGSLRWTEKYDFILADAKTSFNNSSQADITFTSPTDGSTVTSLIATLKGKITDAEIDVTKIVANVNQGSEYTAVVNSDGSFQIPVSLLAGDNYITFRTYGHDTDGKEIECQNNWVAVFIGDIRKKSIQIIIEYMLFSSPLFIVIVCITMPILLFKQIFNFKGLNSALQKSTISLTTLMINDKYINNDDIEDWSYKSNSKKNKQLMYV